MDIENVELLLAELDHDDAVKFIESCKVEGVSCSEKIVSLIQIFLSKGDNHLLGAGSHDAA